MATTAEVAVAEKIVRVPIDAEVWKSFRLLAIKRDMTVSGYLTELVEREVNRRERLEDKRHARTDRPGD